MAIKACAICPFNFYIIIIFYKNIYKNIIQKKYIYTKKIIYNKGKGQRAKGKEAKRDLFIFKQYPPKRRHKYRRRLE